MKNNYAYIDGQNLHFGIKLMGWKIDHKKFRAWLETEMGVTRAYIFLGFMEEHQDLYNVLQEAGFICHFKPLVRYDDGNIKGNVDADMVLQVMIDVEKYDQAVIISGDGDFSSMLRHLLLRNKLAQIVIPNRDKYSSLFDRIDNLDDSKITFMNDLKSKINYGFTKKQHQRPRHGNSGGNGNRAEAGPRRTSSKGPRPNQNRTSNNAKTNDKPSKATSSAQRAKKPNAKPATKKTSKVKPAAKTRDFKPKAALEKSLIEAIDSSS